MSSAEAEQISTQSFFEENPGKVSTAFSLHVTEMENAALAVAAAFGNIGPFWAEITAIDESYEGRISDQDNFSPASRVMIERYNDALDMIQNALKDQL